MRTNLKFSVFTFYAICMGFFLALSANSASAFPPDDKLIEAAHTATDNFVQGKVDVFYETLDDTMKKYDAKFYDTAWNSVIAQYGAYQKMGKTRVLTMQGYRVVEHTLEFEKQKLIQRTVFNNDGKVAGFFFLPGEVN